MDRAQSRAGGAVGRRRPGSRRNWAFPGAHPRAVAAHAPDRRADRPRDPRRRDARSGDRRRHGGRRPAAPALGNDRAVGDRGAAGVGGFPEIADWLDQDSGLVKPRTIYDIKVLRLIAKANSAISGWSKVRNTPNANVLLAASLLHSRWNR